MNTALHSSEQSGCLWPLALHRLTCHAILKPVVTWCTGHVQVAPHQLSGLEYLSTSLYHLKMEV